MTTLRVPLAEWGKSIADIDIDALQEWLNENPYSTMSDEDIVEQWCDDLPEHLHQDFCREFDAALQRQVESNYMSHIKEAIADNTTHVLYELSPARYHPCNYTCMDDLPQNFPEMQYVITPDDHIVFAEKSLAALSLAIMACLQGQHGERYEGIREFHDVYCISGVADLSSLVHWLGKYWGIFGDSPLEVQSDNLDSYFFPHIEAKRIKNELMAVV